MRVLAEQAEQGPEPEGDPERGAGGRGAGAAEDREDDRPVFGGGVRLREYRLHF